VTFPRFAGTDIPRDCVEFPSQVNELWARWPEVLRNDTRHHRTGDRFRAALLSRGGSDDTMTLFRNFRGAAPDLKPLLVRRGLDAPRSE
jgi:Zn-dependent oligopeptidase